MADISPVKLYFMEQYNGPGYEPYPDSSLIPADFQVLRISATDGDIITTASPHGLYPDTLITPAPMILDVDLNAPGAPGSRAVKVLDACRLELLSPLPGIAAGHYITVYKWVDRTGLLLAGTLTVTRQDDHSDSAQFDLLTVPGGFMPYAGMHVLIKYGGGFSLFGGVVKSTDMEVLGEYRGASSRLKVSVSADTYSVLAKRRVLMVSNYWINTRADVIVRQMLDILKQEGATEGVICEGLYLDKYPSEKNGTFSVVNILDSLAEQCGYIWYINPDRALFFVPKEASYNPASQAWEPYITNAPFNIQDGGSFTDYGGLSLSTGIEMYTNTVHLEGGEDRNKREAYSLGRDDGQILLAQLRTGGSGVWGDKVENNEVDFLVVKTAESGSSGGHLFIQGHELQAGDYVFNVSRNYKSSRVSEVASAGEFYVYGTIDAQEGDIIGWYPQANAIIRAKLKNYGSALPKKLSFTTYTIGTGQKIWAPGQRVILGLAAFGAAGYGNYITRSVEYSDAGGILKIKIDAELRDPSFFE